MLLVVSWIDWYHNEMKYMFNNHQEDSVLMAIIETLMNAFIYSSKIKLTNLVDNILLIEDDNEIETDAHGIYFTTGPQDLFFTVNQQLSVILSYGLKGHGLMYVAKMLKETFLYHQNQQMKIIEIQQKLFNNSSMTTNDYDNDEVDDDLFDGKKKKKKKKKNQLNIL